MTLKIAKYKSTYSDPINPGSVTLFFGNGVSGAVGGITGGLDYWASGCGGPAYTWGVAQYDLRNGQ